MSLMPPNLMRGGVALCIVTLASACATTATTSHTGAGPEVAEVAVAEPIVSEVIVAEPIVAEPIVAEPIVAEPIVAAPMAEAAPSEPLAAPVSADSLRAGVADVGGAVAGIVGGLAMASELDMLGAQYLAGALVAYAIYDPLAPTWRIELSRAGSDRVRMALRMKSLITGGEGEARQVFIRNARRMVEAGGFAGYDVISYEEGMESTRPFARRVASGEIRLVRSRQFPEF